eukprot:GFUD01044915.1.p1 GENE.GFUD01044915.1~~GFUD01044915.1.p1  ORF type:complete len:662 (+),score=134.14 GFUD01044915.1:124-2109(+)
MFTSSADDRCQQVSTSNQHPNNMFSTNYGLVKPLIQPTVSQSSSYESNSPYSTDVSRTPGDSPPPQNYQLKTMCLAKKCVQMPTKEEHGFLLFCGLGARKWQCAIDCNSLTFKQAILNIYPRLRSVIGYNLWTLTKDKKTFEKIPEKVNTPRRMRAYLGSHFTGCLIIVPVSDIVLMEEKREHLRQIDIKQVKDVNGRSVLTPAISMDSEARQRSLCLICGKIEKTPGTGSFHRIMEESMSCHDGTQVIARKLTDILGFNFEQSKRKFIASTEICKKCLRAVCDVVKMEEQLKRQKEDLVCNFFSTTSKFNKNQGTLAEEPKPASPQAPRPSEPAPRTSEHHISPTSNSQDRKGFNTTPTQNGYTHPFLMQSLPQSVAFLNHQPAKQIQFGSPLVQFYRPNHQEFQKLQSDVGSMSQACSSPERRENPNYQASSDYAASEVGSSCFLSISPPPKEQEYIPVHQDSQDSQDQDSQAGSISPRAFDVQSYASTFSFRSTNSSMRSKAEIKQYGHSNAQNLTENAERISEQAECLKLDNAERYQENAERYQEIKTEKYINIRGEKRSYESNEASPMSEESPRSTGTPSSESFESTTPNASSPTPEDDLAAEEERAERRKPWKKRKRVHESDLENSTTEMTNKMEDSNESPDCQDQLDASTSDQN